eukprot:3398843-Prymnesium_polylepis.1
MSARHQCVHTQQAQPRTRHAARQRTHKPDANADDASPATHAKHANVYTHTFCRSRAPARVPCSRAASP